MKTRTTLSGHSGVSTEKMVILGSTLGTLFEWYDFFLYGAMASVFSKQFFSALSPSSAYLFALIAFGVGFAVRPLGALIFGRLGDKVGRKTTFLLTIVLMGGSTFFVGLLPTYNQVGIVAPILLLTLRVLQGLGLGGEYGGAAVYVAEHSASGHRGRDTSWIQMTGAGGTVLALLAVFLCRSAFGEKFDEWAWRVPFLISAIMLGVSIYIRTKLHESPVFQKMKDEGQTAAKPLREVFGSWSNIKQMLIALFGLVMGMTTVLYTAQIYTFFFLSQTLHLDVGVASLLSGTSLVIALPMMWLAGALSDKIGRKKVVMTGLLLAACTTIPIFHGITHYANPQLERASAQSPVVVHSPAGSCGVQFDLLGNRPPKSDCEIVRAALAKAGVPYAAVTDAGITQTAVSVGAQQFKAVDLAGIRTALAAAGYATKADASQVDKGIVLLLLVCLCAYFTMVYAPLAAALVDMFPARVRYTALSFPYHLGNGIFGGFFPAVAFAMVTATGDIYFGLWYTVVFAAITFVVGGLFLKEQRTDGATEDAPEFAEILNLQSEKK